MCRPLRDGTSQQREAYVADMGNVLRGVPEETMP
jgi:hypothetical protein